ncbi:ABC transporter ATP-binding protein [Candidatus Uabimicrobium sp. HlEnr_7]|uniref:ABC transporter ATP-binding protein n=1 Tax=Candidatus Uabimicrobium helgolandensis TaxID=3095367 RepID=UPI003556BACC
MKNSLFEIRQVIMKARKQGWIPEESIGKINRMLRTMENAGVPEILTRFQEEKILSEGEIQLLEAQLRQYREGAQKKGVIKKKLFSLRDVYKHYKTPEGTFYALKGISLNIYHGEILAVLGFSGSGKSTFLNILGLLVTADEGSYIDYKGTRYEELSSKERDELRKKEFGFIFQESHLFNHLSALENVALPLRLQKKPNKECTEKAASILSRFMTKDELKSKKVFFNKKPNQFSGGQKQRIAAARAMVHSPKVIFADEPTGSLDYDTGQMVMDALFEAAAEEKVTVIFVTHNHSQARQYCERFVWMEGGEFKNQVVHSPENTMVLVKQLTGKELSKKKRSRPS